MYGPSGNIAPIVNAAFWNRFGSDYRANCLAWNHDAEPILPPGDADWRSRWTANPDIIDYKGRTLLIYRGNDGVHDRIGVREIVSVEPFRTIELAGGRPVLDVGRKGEFDDGDVLDPAAVEFEGRLWLYYSAVGTGEDRVGLAVSDDGERFEKLGPVLVGRAPEVVLKGGRIHMTYQRFDANGGYALHLAASDDARTFVPVGNGPIFPREKGGWDALSLVTGRIAEEDGTFYMLYGGSAYLPDEPDHFGLARSTDLVAWEPHPGNPIFGCGPKGSPDGGAIWFPALLETRDGFTMLYEGSRGKYSWDLSSAICRARIVNGEPEG